MGECCAFETIRTDHVREIIKRSSKPAISSFFPFCHQIQLEGLQGKVKESLIIIFRIQMIYKSLRYHTIFQRCS